MRPVPGSRHSASYETTMTLIGVASLALPEFLVEVEAIAVVD